MSAFEIERAARALERAADALERLLEEASLRRIADLLENVDTSLELIADAMQPDEPQADEPQAAADAPPHYCSGGCDQIAKYACICARCDSVPLERFYTCSAECLGASGHHNRMFGRYPLWRAVAK